MILVTPNSSNLLESGLAPSAIKAKENLYAVRQLIHPRNVKRRRDNSMATFVQQGNAATRAAALFANSQRSLRPHARTKRDVWRMLAPQSPISA